jgi:hypothetical protein
MFVKFVSGRSVTWDDSLYDPLTELARTNSYNLDAIGAEISDVKGPYIDGRLFYGLTMEPREMMLEYLLMATDEASRDVFIQTVKTAFNPKDGYGLLTVTLGGGVQRAIWCIPKAEPLCMTGAGRRINRQLLQVWLYAPRPFWLDPVMKSATLSTFSGGLCYPWRMPWTFGLASTEANIVNAGNVPTPLVITFHGEIMNPRIDNLTTGQHLAATMTLAEGETLEINTGPGEHRVRYVHGGVEDNGFQYLDSESDFIWFMPGTNQVSFSASSSIGAAASCTIDYFDQYLGV